MNKCVFYFIGLSLFFIFGTVVKAENDESLILYFMFDEVKGGKVTDLSLHGNDGEIKGKPKIIEGKEGQALEFTSPSDYVEVPHSESLNITEEITIAVWVKWNGGRSATLSKVYTYWLGPNTDIEYAYQKGGNNVLVHSGKDLPMNEWYHIAVTQDKSGKILMYLNGEQFYDDKQGMPRDSSAEPLTIAKESWGTPAFNGGVDEVRIYNRVLSEKEIAKIMVTFGVKGVESKRKLSITWGSIKAEFSSNKVWRNSL